MDLREKRIEMIFQKFKMDLRHTNIPSIHFIKSAWETIDEWPKNGQVSLRYLAYRGIFLVYFLFALPQSIYRDPDRHLWLIWATNISLLVQSLYALVSFVNVSTRFVQNWRRRQEGNSKGNKYLESPSSSSPTKQIGGIHYVDEELILPPQNRWETCTWFLLNLTGTYPYMVTIAFWLFVDSDRKRAEGVCMAWYLTDHGINAILAFIDTLVIDIPIRLAPIVYTILTAIIYLIFLAIYEYAGGSYIYEDEPYVYVLLNWRQEPVWALVNSFIAIFFSGLFHVYMWLVYKIRIKMVSKLNQKRSQSSTAIIVEDTLAGENLL